MKLAIDLTKTDS